jgi:hypothetical protein
MKSKRARVYLMRHRFCLTFYFFAGLLFCATPAMAQNDDIKLELIAPKSSPLGEAVQVTLHLSSKRGTYQIQKAQWDRSGRVPDYGFTATDAEGKAVRDPVPPSALGGFGGGQRWDETLTPQKPFEQTVTASEWLAFDKTGRYFVRAWAAIVYKGKINEDPPVRLESAPVDIEITAPDEESRQARLKNARYLSEETMRDLRFMLDARAIPLLVRGFVSTERNVPFQARLGLLAFLDKAPIAEELRRAIADEDYFIASSRYFAVSQLLIATAPKVEPDELKNIRAQITAKLAKLPPERAAPALVDALHSGGADRTSVSSWRAILKGAENSGFAYRATDYVLEMLRSPQAIEKLDKELMPDFLAVAQNEKLGGQLRLTALATAHLLGYENGREMMFQDVIALKTRLLRDDGAYGPQVPEAQLVLGDYRAREIAEYLLQAAHKPKEAFVAAQTSYRSVARRLRDFGAAASVDELIGAFHALNDKAHDLHDSVFPLIQAIAAKSPTAVVPLLHTLPVPKTNEYSKRWEAITDLLARLDGPEAEAWRQNILKGQSQYDTRARLSGFTFSLEDAKEKRTYRLSRDLLPPRPEFAYRAFPEILNLFLNSPSRDVRANAHYCLTRITGKGQFAMDAKKTLADDRSFLPAWRAWWQDHHTQYAPKP